MPVLSANRLRGPADRRLEISTVMYFCLRLRVEKSGTGQSGDVPGRGVGVGGHRVSR